MRKTEFDVALIPEAAEEALMGAFAVRLEYAHVGILYSDGAAFIISLSDYTEITEEPLYESDIQLTSEAISYPESYLKSRNEIALHLNTAIGFYLNTAKVPSGILKLRTAAPLNGTDTLGQDTKFYRFTATKNDICFDYSTGKLQQGTYLATANDVQMVNTGYGAVGRYSLPCPYPARFLQEYFIPKGTTIQVGTVEPQFRQSGGGVEVKLDSKVTVLGFNTTPISDY